jgi:SH3-like domain-containing protein
MVMVWSAARALACACALVVGMAASMQFSPAGAQPARESAVREGFATLRTDEINGRSGPGRQFPTLWRYVRAGVPVKVVDATEGWRKIVDPDGVRSWVVASAVAPRRGVIVTDRAPAEGAALHAHPDNDSRTLALLKPGVTGQLGECRSGWCRVSVDHGGRTLTGWMARATVWGAEGDTVPTTPRVEAFAGL